MENITVSELIDDLGKTKKGKASKRESIAPYMKQAELMVEVLIKQGKLPKDMDIKIKGDEEKERKERYEKWLAKIFHNTEELLKNYHKYKYIEKIWFDELTSQLDLPSTTSQKELSETIKYILDYETAGHEKLNRSLAHIRPARINIIQLEYGLKALYDQSKANDNYLIIKNAFIDNNKNIGKKNQREMLFMRYGVDLPESTYYKKRKKALRELSLFIFGARDKEYATLNMFATIIMPDYDISDEMDDVLDI